ncbi:PREDICTED: intraflagellar transport protein 88 homolog [Priapulus caudatus]|uniref:Intraflagellar transport protein 88 homolog n=1 Tax=Priapulus caudatus TaxID=37621 RepID=A0ABM1EPT4_PRICU|nr:PREDICTED: intraflagellar transport protein 88 homolog [Priapulus caudatus]
MENVHLVPDDEDDLYSGFNTFNPALATNELEHDEGFQQAVKTSHGRRPPPPVMASVRTGSGRLGTSAGRTRTGMTSSLGRTRQGSAEGVRPMTAVRAVGFTSAGNRNTLTAGGSFDPLGETASRGPPPLEKKLDDSPEDKIKKMEKRVMDLVEESQFANSTGDLVQGLEKAKHAGRQERQLVRQREQTGNANQESNMNLDLTYTVLFNLACQYVASEMWTEALSTFHVIIKNRMFSNAGRLKVNIGNIYFKQKDYPKAIKYYRMALDQIPTSHKDVRMRIMQNIGIVFVKMGQFQDAITSFEHIMSERPDFKTGFNLLLCYYALNDKDKMKKAFLKLLQTELSMDDEDKYLPSEDAHSNLILEAIKNDSLRKIERQKRLEAERCVITAAKIISPSIDVNFTAGYDWCVEQVKASNHAELAHNLDINKAIAYLKQKDFNKAVDTLKGFERKDSKLAVHAATNLSFLYFLQKEYAMADKYAEIALTGDRYNPSALVNKGNVLYMQGDVEKALEFYNDALNNEASCVEALYNLGLVYKKLSRKEESMDCFYKLHAILRNHPEVMFQIAKLYEQLDDPDQAMEWYMQLVGVVPSDPTVLKTMGELCDYIGDKSQAYQYHYDSYRYMPSNMEVVEWLGAYFVDSQFPEKAIHYFERAALVQPSQVKWRLMVASCHRRSGNYQQAFNTYKLIHKKFPDNVECLKFLVRLCTDMGLKETQEYANKLKKAEKAKELRDQRISSGRRPGSSRGSRISSAESERSSASGNASRSRPLSTEKAKVDLSSAGPYEYSKHLDVDVSYKDPLGPQMERPRTSARRKEEKEEDFADEELGDDLLPE